MPLRCPKHPTIVMQFLAGRPAHQSNLYCPVCEEEKEPKQCGGDTCDKSCMMERTKTPHLGAPMSEHQKRHRELHSALDELLTDFITHNPEVAGHLFETPLSRLLAWSHEQMDRPTERT